MILPSDPGGLYPPLVRAVPFGYDTRGPTEWRSEVAQKSDKSQEPGLLGVGLDGQDGHTRLTRGENFRLLGGSHETHEQMQEQCIKFNEKLAGRGKELQDLERREFLDLAAECEMNVVELRRQRGRG
jgi:hypothetical protein